MIPNTSIDSDEKIFAKPIRRLVPFLGLLYFVSFLDRVNVSFAAASMSSSLALGPEAYGLGAGLFFLAYSLLEVPSNIILARVGARMWIFRIMITWGLVSASMSLVHGRTGFYIARLMLGAAEAGFFPGVIFYLGCWFPADMRARVLAAFIVANPLSTIIGAPLSAAILAMDGMFGLSGWRWLFLCEGLPAVILAFIVLRFLPNDPADATWLEDEERRKIVDRLAREPASEHKSLWSALRAPRLWVLALPFAGIVLTAYGVQFWLPQIVKVPGFSATKIALLIAFPYVLAAVAMVFWGRRSDRKRERTRHFAGAAAMAALGYAGAALFSSELGIFLSLTVATVGVYATYGPYWSIPSSFLGGTAAAGGVALINSIGGLGGFAGPYLMGWVRQSTGGYQAGMGIFAVVAAAAAIAMVCIGAAQPSGE